MSKLLILCEGPNEVAIIDLLLKHNLLKFTSDDLVGLVPYHARQLTSIHILNALRIYQGEFTIIRIGDKQSDILKIPKQLRHRILGVQKFCTKPELELLLIINEGLYHEYVKVSSKTNPKSFAKCYIHFHKKHYDNSSQFYFDYYDHRISCLVENIKEYKKLKKHEKDEGYLYDLLKIAS